MDLDLDFVRAQFPAFSEPSLAGTSFFENAGGSYACAPTIARLERYYRETKVQPYAAYAASARAGREMDSAYTRFAAYLNVEGDEVHFGPSTSQNTYVLANAFRGVLSEGDEIVVTNQDHEANSGSWRRLAGSGVTVREWPVDAETGLLDPAALDGLLTERTRLVAFPHASNIVAHLNPVADIAARAHAVGARVAVDGVAHAGHGFPDIQAIGADIYLFSLYKAFGPHQGVMVIRRDLADKLENQSHYFNAGKPRKMFVPAGPDHAQIAAANGVIDYFDMLHEHHFATSADPAERNRRVAALMRAHEQRLLGRLLDWLAARNDVRILGPADAAVRNPTVAVETLSRPPLEVLETLTAQGILADVGNFYAVRLLEAMGFAPEPGVLRLSFVHYTDDADMDRLLEALDRAL